MSCGRMAAHASHVISRLTISAGIDASDIDLIVLSVASSVELENICIRLVAENIKYVEYRDTDHVFEGELLTAIATWPIEKEAAGPLKELRPWCCKCNESSKPG